MTDPGPASDPSGCVTSALGAILMVVCIGAGALCVMNKREEMAAPYAIAASICFAGIAISEALRRRR